MREMPDELTELDALLKRSHAAATDHLRGIISERRTLSANQLVQLLDGM